jgi:hypothetical protein
MLPAIIGGAVALGNMGAGIYNSYKERESKSKGRAATRQARNDAATQYGQMMGDIQDFYDQRGSLGTEADANAYRQAIGGYDPNSFVYNRGQFGYNKTRDDFLNPNYDKIIGDTAATVQHTAAGAGLGRGTGAATSIADAVVKKNEELYNDAQRAYEADRDFAYKSYSDYAQAMQDALNQKRAATESKIALQGNLAQDYYNTMDSRQSDLLKLQQDRMATLANYDAAIAGLY